MSSPDPSNHLFQLATRFVNQTSRSFFLTGKAGTGKTTFLKYIRENSFKKMAIVAPTGVAAINAGGVTMHSFFQLPFGAFIPSLNSNGWNTQQLINNPHTLLKNLRLSHDKKELMRELELLVIDEVSMLRADLLDAIDLVLRHVRLKASIPFGGVQVLYIGDLFQLPPVTNAGEWELLREYYRSPFFFDAQVLQQAPPLYLELKKIYRQHETDFINVLNNIRNNQTTEADLARLHQHYRPGYIQAADENYITLTSHNSKADTINQQQLRQLSGELYEFKGEITKDFNEKALPAERTLQLKEGAQVMFIKNDKGESRRYYNGRIATIKRIQEEKIFVSFPGENYEMELEKETWKNIRYQYNKEKDSVEEEELGTYTQYPIRLAWAITIHKSQGLTFEKAIIDAGASFAPGQVYVALSRLTSLEGLILCSRIHPSAIQTDERALTFTRSEPSEELLQQQLQEDQKIFIGRTIVQSFDWTKLSEAFKENYEDYEQRQIPDKNAAVTWAHQLLQTILQQQEMALRFTRQLEQLLLTAQDDHYQFLHQRIVAAGDYFLKPLDDTINAIKTHIEEVKVKQKTRKYVTILRGLLRLPEHKKQEMLQAIRMADGLKQGEDATQLLQAVEAQKKSSQEQVDTSEEKKTTKAPKGETKRISLQLFKEGKSIGEIATVRGMAFSTIESHLASFINTGEINITALVSLNKVDIILKAMEGVSMPGATPLKNKLGEEYSYGEIRAVIQHREWLQQESKKE